MLIGRQEDHMMPLKSMVFLCQAAMDAVEGSGESGGALSFNRDATQRQQGMLRFSAHLALSLSALGLLPPPHDMSASLAFRDLQVCLSGLQAPSVLHCGAALSHRCPGLRSKICPRSK